MKKLLLATVATLALTASGFAAEPGDQGKAGATPHGQATGGEMKGRSGGAEMKGHAADTRGHAAGAEIKGKAQTTGSGASAESGTKSEMKGAQGRAEKNGARDRRETTGQGTEMQKSEPAPKANSNTIKNDNGMGSKGARSNDGKERTGERAGDSNHRAESDRSGGSVSLTAEQKTKIRSTVVASGPKIERSQINFSLSVGTKVPRSGVRFVAVPPTLIEIHPAWRGYEYFVVGDEIVIVNPRTLEIVAIVEV